MSSPVMSAPRPKQNGGSFGQSSEFSPTSSTFYPHSWFGKTFGLPKPEAGYPTEATYQQALRFRPQGERATWDTLNQTYKYDWSIARDKYDLLHSSRLGESAFSAIAQPYADESSRRTARLQLRTGGSGGGGGGSGAARERSGTPSSFVPPDSRDWAGDASGGGDWPRDRFN